MSVHRYAVGYAVGYSVAYSVAYTVLSSATPFATPFDYTDTPLATPLDPLIPIPSTIIKIYKNSELLFSTTDFNRLSHAQNKIIASDLDAQYFSRVLPTRPHPAQRPLGE